MTYTPKVAALGYEEITTSEQLSGRNVDGVASYVKLIKQSGALGTGDVTVAHGITGATRWVSLSVGIEDAVPQWFGCGSGNWTAGASAFGLGSSIDGTNATLHIGTSWTGANALSNAWIIVEYLK